MAKITILPSLLEGEPEITAMLQAFYSRSPTPIKDRLKELHTNTSTSDKIKKALSQYYIGYGHKSIGDTGSFTIFIEGCSILAAKAIQNSKLYNGQESSTRYIDWSNQPFKEPLLTGFNQLNRYQLTHLHIKLREFYLTGFKAITENLWETYKEHEELADLDAQTNAVIKEKAIKAKAFDIMRGFLPAGATTQLSWHTTFSHFNDHIEELLKCPLFEVVDLAVDMMDEAAAVYPSTIKKINLGEEGENLPESDLDYYEFFPIMSKNEEKIQYSKEIFPDWDTSAEAYKNSSLDAKIVQNVKDNLDAACNLLFNDYSRLKKVKHKPTFIFDQYIPINYIIRKLGQKVPRHIDRHIQCYFNGQIDYGSWRDLQRHRNMDQSFPLLDTQLGINHWYLDSLIEHSNNPTFEDKWRVLQDEIETLAKTEDKYEFQYYMPMLYMVHFEFYCTLNQAIYLAELRSTKYVHPTLRVIALEMAKEISNTFKNVELKIDDTPLEIFNLKRGRQDIVKKVNI